ncbi:long-chain fatty acid--CoA ligase [Streptomyces albidoflavus]|uniref:class I adenylate-forming enzyme family protein n=1 Tax=Streptomyces albidoflavus TaxID=1886 RepID=UPI000FEFF53F|nr:class I adenylate-forming enzyme family protein [Streptomyces albidoflavus]RWZ77830.1 long-chain fatty acid--CoA ligase [Streptomyces albidoflavus]
MPSSADTPRTLGGLLAAAADRWPGRPAVEQGGVRLDFADLHRQTGRAAARLAAAGAGPGRTAVLLFDNTPDCVVAFLAAARTGARLVPAEPGATLTQLTALAAGADGPVLIGRAERLAALDAAGGWPGLVVQTDGLPQAGPADRPAPAEPDGDAPFLHQFSSGSTGAPKAAVHTQHNLVQGSLIYRSTFGYGPGDTVVAAVPLLHSFGMVAGLVTSLLTGARLVLLGRFTPGRLLGELHRTGATVLVATPLACDLLARSAGAAAAAGPLPLRLCLSSGAALHPATAERFAERFGVRVSEVYGCTEAGIIASRQPEADAGPGPDGARAPAGGVGRPVPGVEVRLVDETGADVAPGAEGLLLVRTPAMFLGYLDRPGTTAEVLRDGWYRTGDLARLDGAGRLHLIGRKDTFVNVGGKKVNPVEVERVLLGHPLLAEAVVWGEDLPDGGQRVRATVVATGPLTAAELGAWCRERLQPHQVPGGVEFVAALPKSSSGKIRRAEVAEAAGDRSRTSDHGGTRS